MLELLTTAEPVATKAGRPPVQVAVLGGGDRP
jgi:hypothetical protein